MGWTLEMERRLLEGVAAGKSRGQMAKKLGVSRSAAIVKYARLTFQSYPSDGVWQKEQARLAGIRRRERLEREKKAMVVLKENLAAGLSRYSAFKIARDSGASWKAIAKFQRVSHQAIQQIVAYHFGDAR